MTTAGAAHFRSVQPGGVDTAPAILELARCLGALGKVTESLKCIDACGIHSNKEGNSFLLIQSHESLGDVNRQMTDYLKAKNSYQAALGVFKYLSKEAARYGDKATYTKWESAVKERLQRKIAEINRLLDIGKYGKGFVDYRDAQNVRLKKKDYPRAMLLYDAIRENHAGTVYAEAARAYKMLCLLELSQKKVPGRSGNPLVNEYEKQLLARKNFLKGAKRNKVPEASLEAIEASVKNIEGQIAKAKEIPYSEAALTRWIAGSGSKR